MQKFIRSFSALLVLAFFSMATQALTLSAVQSRKIHAGSPRDISINLSRSVSGAVTVEPRQIGAGHDIVFQFDAPIASVGGVVVTDESGAAVTASAPSVNGNQVSVTIPSLADAKRVNIRLITVNGTLGADFSASMGFLVGDTNSSGSVTAPDVAQVKSRAGRAVDSASAGYDFNTTGFITAADISAVKARQTRALPPAYTVGGTVSGLTGTLVLQQNGENLYITSNGAFTFPSAAINGYTVLIAQQPAGQLCSLTNNTGPIIDASISDVAVSCVAIFATTIYDIKRGTVVPGTVVQLTNKLVTGVLNGAGFFLQVKSSDPEYTNEQFSGIFVFDSLQSQAIVAGKRVNVTGTVVNNDGRFLLDASSITVLPSPTLEALPLETPAASADIATGGASVAALDGVRVRVSNVQVIARNVGSNEFTVTGGLIVDDLLYTINPLPNQGQVISALAGTLSTFSNVSRLLPASAGDIAFPVPSFDPAISYLRVGAFEASSFPVPLTVSLGASAFGNTFVPISYSDTNGYVDLVIKDNGVTIPDGQSSANVLISTSRRNLSRQGGVFPLTAVINGYQFTRTLRVIGLDDQPVLTTFTPQAPVITTGGNIVFEVTLDIPAPTGGTVVNLALNPPGAGTIPATVTIPANTLSASFSYTDLGNASAASITATAGGSSLTANITINTTNSAGFVINEVDYDQVGTDTASFIELYNGTSSPINLTGLALVLINGATNNEYARYDLGPAGTLAPGQYLVVGNTNVVAAAGAVKYVPAGVANTDFIQNGAPDAVALINTATQTVIDSLSYEGAITAANITGFPGPVNLVRGRVLPVGTADSNTVNGSLCRLPNGTSTNDDQTDWKFCTTSTPGAANVQ